MVVQAGYKQTEVGVIPEDWDLTSLGEIFTFKNGLNKSKEFFGFGTPIVNYMDVYKNSKFSAYDLKGKVNLNKQEIKAYEVKKGDVFFTRTSETVEDVGVASVIIDEPHDTVYSGFVLRARPKNENLDDHFKRYCFSSNQIRKAIVSKATYTTRALTNGRILSGILMPLPPLPEQRAIATALSDADDHICLLDKVIAKKRDLKQTVLELLLSGKKRLSEFVNNNSYKWTELGLVPKEWDIYRLQKNVELRGRIGWRHLTTNDYSNVGPILLCGKDILSTNQLDLSQPTRIPFSKYDESPEIQVKKGDVLLVKTGEIGKSCAVMKISEPMTINAAINILRPKNELDSLYLHYFVSSSLFQQQMRFSTCKNAQGNVFQRDIANLFYLCPRLSEQRAIATVLSDMDAELAALEQKRDKTKAIKQGMMQELLTGRIRLT